MLTVENGKVIYQGGTVVFGTGNNMNPSDVASKVEQQFPDVQYVWYDNTGEGDIGDLYVPEEYQQQIPGGVIDGLYDTILDGEPHR